MKAANIRILPHLHRIAEQRAGGLDWSQIAAKLKIDEDSIRILVIAQPQWDRLLADARREFAANLATRAMVALGEQLQSDDPKLRMNAAIPLLRLHQTHLRQVAKTEPADFAMAGEFAEPSPPDDAEAGNAENISPQESEHNRPPAATEVSPTGEVSPKARDEARSRPLPPAKAERNSLAPPNSDSRGKGRIDPRRNLLLTPLISAKINGHPPDRKR